MVPATPAPANEPAHRLTDHADAVLAVVERIPEGRVLTYGDIAGVVGQGGPRQVGSVLARYGGAVPWWRVVRADGRPAAGHERRALAAYHAEGTPLRPGWAEGTIRVDLRDARWADPR
ncbi:MGMT family protein [Streptomyces sp. DSM 44915]|uniref:MGMT family protein n=2 Tax=Streptomyces chisholmiae TaxID=3075540 RepID=A0ABU2JKH6_9ACTN|nr:MGMT family protein [Streptomyces sp. DSM 44915]MDT0265487.1 MGMT family protein [Streptomyces sp. DSM 44915]